MVTISVDEEKCEGCGECVDSCPGEVFELNDGGKSEAVNLDECTECCTCIEVCPNDAITHDSCE